MIAPLAIWLLAAPRAWLWIGGLAADALAGARRPAVPRLLPNCGPSARDGAGPLFVEGEE